ncbi:MAG: GGDEF domain-containing protein [Xanthomonadales bacterium]|nr:GGDEF domain-containing protein [Xanthomonadales bacterium]
MAAIQASDTHGSKVEREAFLESILRALIDPVFVLDRDGRYLDVFGAIERRAYDSPEYLIGKTLYDVMPSDAAEEFLAEIRRVLDTGEVWVGEYRLSAAQCVGNPQDGPDGEQWFLGRMAPLYSASGGAPQRVAWVVVNISERKRLEQALQRLANTDELTGMLNRRAFLAEAETALAGAQRDRAPQRLQFALIDLDHFKQVNDRYGHLVGDGVLKHVADALNQCLRRAVVGRIGGEEFAAYWIGVEQEVALEELDCAENLLRSHPFLLGKERIDMLFSAGLCAAELVDRHPTDLLRRADLLLYDAKDLGRARICRSAQVERRRSED